jgi:hypothetical protein
MRTVLKVLLNSLGGCRWLYEDRFCDILFRTSCSNTKTDWKIYHGIYVQLMLEN